MTSIVPDAAGKRTPSEETKFLAVAEQYVQMSTLAIQSEERVQLAQLEAESKFNHAALLRDAQSEERHLALAEKNIVFQQKKTWVLAGFCLVVFALACVMVFNGMKREAMELVILVLASYSGHEVGRFKGKEQASEPRE